ncbi:MAG: PASTA domain-containing protein [Synergistaceae bacterium]|nr:PASTA domain-containing protein [Synergistaceae bacterium]
MEKFLKWTVVFIVLIILASGGVAFYSVFMTDKEMILMPSFREMSLIDAIADAEQMGLKARIEHIESKLPEGRVLVQWPEPGTKIRGTDKNIILKVSKSAERRNPMPDIRGIELTRATRMLEEQGFVIGDVVRIKDSSNSGLPAGHVIAQSPASPGSIPVGHHVSLLVSDGSEDGRIAVPNVTQMTESAARRTLESAGLRVSSVEKVNNRNVPEGEVANTSPATGSLVKEGDGIKIFISAREEPKPKPEATTTSIPGRQPTEPILTDTSISVLDQPRRPRDPNVLPERTESSSSVHNDPHSPEFSIPPTVGTTTLPGAPVTRSPDASANTGNKVARVRYQAPPILRPLPLRIEIEDTRGKRVLLERNVRANETVQVDGNYSQEAVVTILLGGEFVWQERYK